MSFNVGDNVRVFSDGYFPSNMVIGGPGNVGQTFVVGSSIYDSNGTIFVGPGGGAFFPGWRRW
jgi:hypothetical protein